MTLQPLPIVQWIRADSVPTLAHESPACLPEGYLERFTKGRVG